MPRVWVTTWGHIGVQGPCCHWRHDYLSGQRYQFGGHGVIQAPAVAEGHVWVCEPMAESESKSMAPVIIEGYWDARGLGYHLGLHWCLRAMLIWMTCGATWGHGNIMSGSVDLQWQRSELMFIVPVTTNGCADAWFLTCHLRPCWCSKTCAATRAIMMSRPKLQPKTMFESIVLLQLGSVLVSMACATTRAHRNHLKAMLSEPYFFDTTTNRRSCSTPHQRYGRADPHGMGLRNLTPHLT